MNGYVKSSVCHSVSGFIRYCRTGTKNDREDFVTEYSTAPFEFWSELAKENRIRHKENKLNKNKKAVEGRQLMVKVDKDNHITAKQFAKHLKKTLGVEVFVFEHWKGNNRHFHIILADRTKLIEPIPARLSPRTYYYDAQGKKCKKADAVKIVPKGTVLNAEQKFSEKIDEFRTKGWLENLKSELFEYLDMTKFDNEKQFAFEPIGTQKVKSNDTEYVSAARERNKFRAELNAYFAEEETPNKRDFCKKYGLTNFDETGKECLMKYIPNSRISEIKEYFAEFEKLYPSTQKTAQIDFKGYSDDELLATYENEVQWLTEAQSDYSQVFHGFDCSMSRLERNAYWEKHQNYPIQWGDVDRAIKRINTVVSENELNVAPISEKAMPSDAVQSAKGIMATLKEVIDYVKELIADLLSEISSRNLEVPELENKEIDLHQSLY